MRNFNGHSVELLAPVGTYEIFMELLDSGADAFYCGGKNLNMRLHRKEFNLTDDELREAAHIARESGKKFYVTLNNLFNERDIEDAKIFLALMADNVKPDALLVQDLSVPGLMKELGVNIPLHASVMMNAHNAPMIKVLQNYGVVRVVASRSMPLADVRNISQETGMEFEYFTHGDMCVAHDSQCHYSGMIFGKSSNRGACMKPCRWHYDILHGGEIYSPGFPLAVKDMYMYENIHRMIDARIVSFKLEGRMRGAEYLKRLVRAYSEHIQDFLDDPLGFDPTRGNEAMRENRLRDFSTAYAFGNPGIANINTRLEGTGAFYSTGKVFSKPVDEAELTEEIIARAKVALLNHPGAARHPSKGGEYSPPLEGCPKGGVVSPAKFSILVNNLAQAQVCLDEKIDTLYLNGDVFLPDARFTLEDIRGLASRKSHTKLFLRTPRVMNNLDFETYKNILPKAAEFIDGLLVSNLGAAAAFKNCGLPLVGDYSMNIYNDRAAKFFQNEGLSRVTMSIELHAGDAGEFLRNYYMPVEVVAHGRLTVMVLEHDLFANIPPEKMKGGRLDLIDEIGNAHPVYKDVFGRNHITLYKELCLLPLMEALQNLGVEYFRIDGLTYAPEELREVIRAYAGGAEYNKEGLTLGAFTY